MADREKVIKGLEVHMDLLGGNCNDCPYHSDEEIWPQCSLRILKDALELLKEQEAKTGKWILDDEDANSWECSECGGLLIINDGTPHENDWYFCPYCGSKLEEQAVKWNV